MGLIVSNIAGGIEFPTKHQDRADIMRKISLFFHRSQYMVYLQLKSVTIAAAIDYSNSHGWHIY